jgi:hypothetical protein
MALADYLYHVTYVRNLQSIAEFGLNPRCRVQGLGGRLRDRCKGRIFFSEFAAVGYWSNTLHGWAFGESKSPLKDGLTPVVLRVPNSKLRTEPDDLGGRDSRGSAWFVTHPIPPFSLQVWTGDKWAWVHRLNFEGSDDDVATLMSSIESAYIPWRRGYGPYDSPLGPHRYDEFNPLLSFLGTHVSR